MVNDKVDKEQYETSIAHLNEIFRGISDSATQVSTWRCPYKNAMGRCTAKFGCRNQSHTKEPDELAICSGSDYLDYRNAWEV